MNKRMLLRLLQILPIVWLPSCAPERRVSPAPVVRLVEAGPSDAERRAEILRHLRAICPQPMTAAELTRAADHLETHPDALWLIQRLDLADRQARICRGEPT
jgi:hypothetical protein